jgi:hypothetical protein
MDYECSANLQVPLLLRLGEDRPALVKAIESGNTDLVYTVLLHLRENMPLGEFQVPWHLTVLSIVIHRYLEHLDLENCYPQRIPLNFH